MRRAWLSTREEIREAVPGARTSDVDQAAAAAAAQVEALTGRRFAPEQGARQFDWPPRTPAAPWRLWLDGNEIIEVTAVTAGSRTLNVQDLLLEPRDDGPPYDRIEVDLGTSAAFESGRTWQRAVTVTGVFGYRNDRTLVGVTPEIATATETAVTVSGPAAGMLGVGTLLEAGGERMLVAGRAGVATGQTLTAALTGSGADTALTVADPSGIAVGELLTVGAERLRVEDRVGTTVVVRRGWPGSAARAHPIGTPVLAERALTVVRGALGTTATAHPAGTSLYRWDPPAAVRQAAALIAAELLEPGVVDGVPTGVTKVQLGDVGLWYGERGAPGVSERARGLLENYRRRRF